MSIESQSDGRLLRHRVVSIEEERIAKVYAQALMRAAVDANAVEEVKHDLAEIVEGLFTQLTDFEEFLASGVIGRDKKVAVLEKTLKPRVHKITYNFLMVLADHDRLGLLRAVLAEFKRLDDQRLHRVPVVVTSAIELSEEQKDRLRESLREQLGQEPILQTRVDPSILGGLVVRIGDWVFDRSVRSQIDRIRKELIARGSHVIQSGRDRFSTPAGN